MDNPRTIYEILQLLENYHAGRRDTYARLAGEATDEMAQILLNHLVDLEDHSLLVVTEEMQHLDPQHATYLTKGPVLGSELTHVNECHCDSNPTFQEALECAFESDQLMDQLLDRLEGCSAAPSVLSLAKRIRSLEEIKERQIANFTRQD